jgi:hypothetical protein
MNPPQEPVVPDPGGPPTTPGGPVRDPDRPDQPPEYDVTSNEGLDEYDKADADSFPASDPPAATQPTGHVGRPTP